MQLNDVHLAQLLFVFNTFEAVVRPAGPTLCTATVTDSRPKLPSRKLWLNDLAQVLEIIKSKSKLAKLTRLAMARLE